MRLQYSIAAFNSIFQKSFLLQLRLLYLIQIFNLMSQSWEISYADDYEQIDGNILKVTPQFVKTLAQNETIVIEGDQDDDFLFTVDNNTYKLRDIFLPSSMLVTEQFYEKKSQKCKSIHYAQIQALHYLKMERHTIQYHLIYGQLMNQAISKEVFEQATTLWELFIGGGISSKQICNRFRLTYNQLELLIKHLPVIILNKNDFKELQEPQIIIVSQQIILNLMRILLPFLMENNLLGKWFQFSQISELKIIKDAKIFALIAKIFDFDVENNSVSESYLSEQMDIENAAIPKFRVKLSSIIHFILLEHALTKSQYSVIQMDITVWNLTLTYLPIGLPEFEEEKAKKIIPQLLGLYFLTIPSHPAPKRLYYDPLTVNSTVRDRLDFLRNFKKKFTLSQIKGIFSHMIINEGDIGNILLKNFRKVGQEYELKLIIPK